MIKHSLPLALLLLLLFSGCIDSLSPEKRFACLDLTEKSYAFVPECKTEEQCFSQLEKRFFEFDHSVFSSETQNALYSYKNRVALSWLYFNKAKASISKIHGICSKNENVSELLFHLNELVHNMVKAFEFSSQANLESFAILLLEYNELQQQDISLVREEPLFNDFSAITGNLNQLNGESACNGNKSYACFYLSQTRNFAGLVAETGFEEEVVSEASVFDLIGDNSKKISDYLESSLSIPFIGSVFPSIISFFSTSFSTGKAMDLLEKTPAFQFTQSYSSFMGTDNSCLTKFAAIIKSDALNRKQLIQRNKELEEKAEQNIGEAQQSLDVLLSEHYASFDQNFFHSLYSGLNQESGLAAQKYSIRDFGELREEAQSELDSLKQRLLQLHQREAVQQLSLGEKAASLKQLNVEVSLLQDNLLYLSNEVIDGLVVLCKERALFIEQQLQEAELPESFIVEASDLRARAKFKVSLFKEAGQTEQKLLLCNDMVKEFDRFFLALQDFEEYRLREQLSLSECFSSIENTLEDSKRLDLELDDFILRFGELQAIERPYPDLEAVKRICLSLKEDLENFILRQPIVSNVEESFALSQELFSSLETAKEKGLEIPEKKLKELKSQIDEFGEFFSGQSILLPKALPLLPSLENSLAEFVSLLKEEVRLLPVEQAAEPLEEIAAEETKAEEKETSDLPQKISDLGSKIALAEEKMVLLETMFSKVSDQQVISAKYVLPLSRKELDNLKLKISNLKSFLGKQELKDSALLGNDPALEEEFDKRLLEVDDTVSRLDSAFNAIKEDAIVSYNSAAELFNQNPGNQEAKEKLEKAQDLLLKGNYLESIVESKGASGLLSLNPEAGLDLPVFVWPIAACSALIFIVRFKKKKKAKQRKSLFKKIEKNW